MNNFYKYYPYINNRSKNNLPNTPIVCPPPPESCCEPKKTPQKKKINFKSLKKDTCTSLNDVEHFLNNFTSTLKYIKLINLLK